MTFSYTGNPLASAKDQVRFLLGDTKDTMAKLSDEEIGFLLSHWEGDEYAAAAAGADMIANNAAAYYDFSSDSGASSIGQLQARYQDVARTIRKIRAQRTIAPFYAGGIDVGDVYAYDNDTTVVHTDFGTGMHDNTREGSYGGASVGDLRGEDWR